MMFRDANHATDDDVAGLMAESLLGRLVTVGLDGFPHVGLYPFVWDGDTIEVHLNRADEQVSDLKGRSQRCVFEVDDALTATPSHWLDPDFAKLATAFHRTVIFECTVAVCTGPVEVAGFLNRVMARYQPEGGFRPVRPSDPLYEEPLRELVGLRLRPLRRRTKFKLHQDRPEPIRAKLADNLRKRGGRNDARTAGLLDQAGPEVKPRPGRERHRTDRQR